MESSREEALEGLRETGRAGRFGWAGSGEQSCPGDLRGSARKGETQHCPFLSALTGPLHLFCCLPTLPLQQPSLITQPTALLFPPFISDSLGQPHCGGLGYITLLLGGGRGLLGHQKTQNRPCEK